MKNIANIKEINTFTINVEEQIEKKYLKNFIKNSIILNSFEYKKDDKIFILYIEEISSYEVIILNSSFEYFIVEVLSSLYNEKKINEIDLYLCDDFFCLFKNSNLYYFQKIELNVDSDELIVYINKKLNITIDNYKKINKDELELIKNDFLEVSSTNILENINKNSNYSLLLYITYLLFIFIFTSLYFLDMQSTKTNKIKPINYEKIKSKYLYNYFHDDFSLLYKRIKDNKLQLKQLDYKNKTFKIVLLSKNKDDIYTFLMSYKSILIENSISYLPLEKLYECTLNVK